jgi:hypothetical protein
MRLTPLRLCENRRLNEGVNLAQRRKVREGRRDCYGATNAGLNLRRRYAVGADQIIFVKLIT